MKLATSVYKTEDLTVAVIGQAAGARRARIALSVNLTYIPSLCVVAGQHSYFIINTHLYVDPFSHGARSPDPRRRRTRYIRRDEF